MGLDQKKPPSGGGNAKTATLTYYRRFWIACFLVTNSDNFNFLTWGPLLNEERGKTKQPLILICVG